MTDVEQRMARAAADRVLYIPLWRTMAIAFAIVSTIWGLLAALLILLMWPMVLAFAPGYAVMAGYYWRGWGRPSRGRTRAIWAASLFVQAAGLVWVVWMTAYSGHYGREYRPLPHTADFVISAWWLITSVASAAGIFFDRGD